MSLREACSATGDSFADDDEDNEVEDWNARVTVDGAATATAARKKMEKREMIMVERFCRENYFGCCTR